MTFAIEIPYLLDKVWLFPAIMAGSFLIILFLGKRLSERLTSAIGITAVTICFIMSPALPPRGPKGPLRHCMKLTAGR